MGIVLRKLTNSLMALGLGIGFSIAATPVAQAADDCVAGFTLVGETCQKITTFSDGDTSLTIPKGLGAIQIELYGGAGGAGGLDGNACARSFGGEVGVLVLMFSDLSDKTLRLYPGDKGKDGASNARGSGGGEGGRSLVGDLFNGGRGGNAGTTGSSGGGGGGGAATILDVGEERYIAAGAGAGGGCANSTNGSTWGATNASYSETSNGGAGLSTSGNPYFDGGGGGGGGGGVQGGNGGLLYKAAGNESAGFGGNAGTNTPVGNNVVTSTYQDSSNPGQVLVKYFPVLGTKSIEVLNTIPSDKNAIEYKLTLKSNRDFSANDVVLSGTAATWQRLTVSVISAKPLTSPYVYTYTVSPANPQSKLVGTLVTTVFDLSSEPIVIESGSPEVKISFDESTRDLGTKAFDLVFSEMVQGLTTSDFTLVSKTSKTCQIGSVSGSGMSYRVTITKCQKGAFGLTLNQNSVLDSSSMAGPTKAVSSGLLGKVGDEVAPRATVVLQPGSLQSTIHVFDVRFSEVITGLAKVNIVPALGSARQCEVGYVVGSSKYFQVSLENCTDGTFGLRLLAESVKDAAGNQGPSGDVVSELSEQFTKAITSSVIPGKLPESLEPKTVTRIFSELDEATQLAIQDIGIYAPALGAPTVTIATDLSNSTVSERIQLSSTQKVEIGSSVRFEISVSEEIAAASDVVAFMETGPLWAFIGRTSFSGQTATSTEFTIANQGRFNIRLLVIGKDVVTDMALPKVAGFGKGKVGFLSSVTSDQTLLSPQQVDITLDAVSNADGGLTPIDPETSTGLGAQTDENAPSEPFSLLASSEGVSAFAEILTVAVAIAGALGAAAAGMRARASSSSAGSSGSESSSQNTDSSEGEISTLDAEVEVFTTAKVSWGDKLPIFKLKIFTFLDRFTHNLTVSLAKFSPVISKIVNDGAYLRSIFGSMWLAAPITGVVLAAVALAQPSIELRPPTWELFLAIAILGMFDAFAGMLATVIYSIGMISIYGISDLSDIRLMLGVLLLGFGPALIGVAFRAIRKQFETSFAYLWDRLVDIAVLTFFIGWSVSAMVATLPALAGRTLVVANYTNEFAIFLAVAIAIRILLEELAARGFSKRLDTINPTEVPSTSQVQKVISTGVRLFLFIFVTAAFMGNVWQVWVGSLIFILPNILSWFQDKFPNYPWLWRLLPQGVPGLALTLIISSVSGAMIGSWLEGNPEYPQYLFMLLPIPVFLLGLIGMFGREGKEDEERPIMAHKWRWVYRIGGIGMLALTMNLAGVLVI